MCNNIDRLRAKNERWSSKIGILLRNSMYLQIDLFFQIAQYILQNISNNF